MTRSGIGPRRSRTALPRCALLIALAVTLLTACALPLTAQSCLPYEPATVTVSGTLTSHDQPRTWWALELSRPICVGVEGDHHTETGVAEIHLLFPEAQRL